MRRRARAIARTQRASVRGALRPERATRENSQQRLLQQFLHDSGCQSLLVPVPNREPGLVSETIELVGGAGEEIAIPITHIDQLMRSVMDSIDKDLPA